MKTPLVLASILALTGVARAEPQASVTFSPAHLIFPVVEVTGEFSPQEHIGIALIGGIGRVTAVGAPGSPDVTGSAYEGGGQFNYYFMRKFSGLHAGVEALYLTITDVNVDSSLSGNGLAIGPYVGYKAVAQIGFTFIAQLGVDFTAVKASNSMQMVSNRTAFPLLNLNIGWSF